jgi:HEAT repeats
MMKRHRVLWVALGLLALLAAAGPAGYYIVLKASGQHFYRGRPTSYWSRETQRWLEDETGWSQPILDRFLDWVSPPSLNRSAPAVISLDVSAFPVLVDLLRDGDPRVRWYAIGYLAALLEADDMLEMPASRAAATALESVGPETVLMVAAGLGDPHPVVRQHVAFLLGHLGPHARDATSALVRALQDNDEGVRETVEKTLTRIKSHTPG